MVLVRENDLTAALRACERALEIDPDYAEAELVTGLSCYTQVFRDHPYTHDLRHLGLFHRQYQRLMQHWREVLQIPVSV
jgi:hypothetical protein